MASKHPKIETFATQAAELDQYRQILPKLQAQAQQAMMMAAEEKGKYLHVLKLFAAILAQNMQKGEVTIVLHKSIVDQPDTINIAREEAEGGYSYRVVSDAEIDALRNAPPVNDAGANSAAKPVAEDDSGPPVEAPEAGVAEPVSPVLRKTKRPKR